MKLDNTSERLEVNNCYENNFKKDISQDTYSGLTAQPKYLSSKYFYDTRGSHLFEEICLLPEYYPTRTELSILKEAASEIMSDFQHSDLVELGSGGNIKIRTLIDALHDDERKTIRYVPVDVSETALYAESEELLEIYPDLKVLCVVADFTQHMELIPQERKRMFTFLGSTIGNFDEKECKNLLISISQSMGAEDRFLIGIDMVKPKEILEAAYNDSKGITAEFNKNILYVVNRELDANFDPSQFEHLAFFNEEKSRIEMHLEANCHVCTQVKELNLEVDLNKGETIRTEISRKFTKNKAEDMFLGAGLDIIQWFSDPNNWFSLVELSTKEP